MTVRRPKPQPKPYDCKIFEAGGEGGEGGAEPPALRSGVPRPGQVRLADQQESA